MLLTQLFGNFSFDLKYKKLPINVIHQAKRCLLDYFASTLVGSKSLESRIIQKVLYEENSSCDGSCTIIGNYRKLSCQDAAMINGVSSHVLDMDDGYSLAMAHPATTVISASIAIAEKFKVSGYSLIEGIVVGYELFCRIGAALQPQIRKKGLHFTGIGGALGAAISSAKIICLDAQATANSISLAATQAPISLLEYLFDGTMMKALPPGRAAAIGVLSALLAREGFTGSLTSLDGDKGFLQAFSNNFSLSSIIELLGKHYSILDVYFKPYPSCNYTHIPIDLILEIKKKYGITSRDIRLIECYTFAAAVDGHSNTKPKTIIAASQSIPYSIAISIIHGKAGIEEYTTNLSNQEVKYLSSKVKIIHDKKMDNRYPRWRPAKIVIYTVKGKVYTAEAESPHGSPEDPLSDKEITNKFTKSAKYVGNIQFQKIKEFIWNIEEVDDFSEFMNLLSGE